MKTTTMKNKIKRTFTTVISSLMLMMAFIPSVSVSAAAKYKVYKNNVTVKMYGEDFTHDEFEKLWMLIYESFGADVTIEMVKEYTNSPHSEEWIRVGGPEHFVDCWFQLHWYAMNDMNDTCYKYYIGEGWRSPEGWRTS